MITADTLKADSIETYTLTINGPYNTVRNGIVQFVRDTFATPLVGLRWFVKSDSDKNADGSDHWYGWMPDWAGFGGYMAFYDSRLDKDIMQIGVHGEQAGAFAIGVDLINPAVQLQIHDFPQRQWTISTWSANGGIQLRSKAKYSDCVMVTREDTLEGHWSCDSQGDTTHDWRRGMEVGSYDYVFCNPNGEHPSTPSNPGTVRFRVKGDGQISSPTIDALKARIAALEKIVLQKQAPATGSAE